MPSYRSASILLAGTVAVGCSAPVVDDVADASGAMTEGAVSVERIVAGDGATQTNVSARFMRLSAPVDPDLAARVVGTKLELPPVGTCRAVTMGPSGSRGTPAAAEPALIAMGAASASPRAIGTIELLDVGDLTLRAGGARMPLAVRAFPDVGDLVSGMFYTSRDSASDLPAGATYTLEGTGSGVVDRFAIDADAPPALEDVRIAGTPLLDGVTLDEGAPVTLQWRPGAAIATSTAPRDIVFVDVSAASGASVRCSFRDDGKGEVPGSILRSAMLGSLPASATVAVHRVRERAFVSAGIDSGEVRFDLSVMGRIAVQPLVDDGGLTRSPGPKAGAALPPPNPPAL